MPRSRLGKQLLQPSQPREYCESCVRTPLANCGFAGLESRTAPDGRLDHRLHVQCPRSLDESQPHVFRTGRNREGIRQAVRPCSG
jgi:hypothetical protein